MPPGSRKGEFRHTKCDRVTQVAEFKRFLMTKVEPRPGLPQFYLLYGEAGQGHQSFIRRLRIEKFDPDAVRLKGAMEGVPRHVEHWTASSPSLEDTKFDFLHGMFEEISGKYHTGPTTLRDLCVHLSFKSYPVVLLEHIFVVEEWGRLLKPLVNWYLNDYWAGYASGASPIQFVVFLNFIYRQPPPSGWRRLLPPRRIGKNSLRRICKKANQKHPCLLFKEFGPPDKEEVCWTLRREGFHNRVGGCPDQLEALFREKGAKIKMIEIENLLESLQHNLPLA